MKDRKAITLRGLDLVKEIRDFSRSQVDLWKRIPWLALEVNGRTGYDGWLNSASISGIWLVHALLPGDSGRVNALVDLLTGDLIDTAAFLQGGKFVPLKDDAVLQFCFAMDRLDASAIVHKLAADADKPHLAHVNVERQLALRENIRRRYNLKPMYDASAVRDLGYR